MTAYGVATGPRCAERRWSKFNAQDLANTAWTSAVIWPSEKLFAALGSSPTQHEEFAKNRPDEKLFASLAKTQQSTHDESLKSLKVLIKVS